MNTGPVWADRSSRVHPFLDHPGPLPFAHRGGASESPENTLAAFGRAIDLGYRYLETDVHATRDGVLMAFHDDDLLRTCGRPGRIGDLTFDEVRRYRVNGSEPIPTLQEVLESFPVARVNIDCKSDGALTPLVNVLDDTHIRERVCIGSFSDSRLRTLRDTFGDSLCTSMGPREVARMRVTVRDGSSSPKFRAHAAQVPLSAGPVAVVSKRFVDRCHERGIHVHVWTIDDAATMHDLLELGVDGIMTDQPTVLKDVLISRGQWHHS